MGICPRCGSWIDAGEPYCPDCSYIINDSSSDEEFSDDGIISINGFEYDADDVVDALNEFVLSFLINFIAFIFILCFLEAILGLGFLFSILFCCDYIIALGMKNCFRFEKLL